MAAIKTRRVALVLCYKSRSKTTIQTWRFYVGEKLSAEATDVATGARGAYSDCNQSSPSFQSAWSRDIADYVQRQRGTVYNSECSQKAYAVSLIGLFIN